MYRGAWIDAVAERPSVTQNRPPVEERRMSSVEAIQVSTAWTIPEATDEEQTVHVSKRFRIRFLDTLMSKGACTDSRISRLSRTRLWPIQINQAFNAKWCQ
jgi:hypothetical protein